MKKYKIIVQNGAKTDLKEIRKWYNKEQTGLGVRFIAEFKYTLLSIVKNPMSFAIRYSIYRKANLRIFPYGIFFFIDNNTDTVYITSVMHHSRNVIE